MLSLIFSAAIAQANEIKFFSASSQPNAPIEQLQSDLPTTFSQARNLKISLVFEKPEPIAKVHLETCAKDWDDGLNIFAAPGLQHAFVEGGKKTFDVKLQAPLRSLAIVFGHDSDVCLKNLKFYDAKDVELKLTTAATIDADAAPGELFDQHPESVKSLEEPVTIKFPSRKKFDRAFIWTGGSPLYAHSLKLTGDKKWSETLPLRDSPSDQEVIFKKPFSGKQITVQAPDGGEVGEIRFALGTKVEAFKPQRKETKIFEQAGFTRTLDFKWVTGDDETDKWLFIFRQDGTFFVRGYSDEPKQARDYSALGSYTILRSDKNKIRMKLNGVRFPTGLSWDGVSCPFSCGNEGALESASTITDTIMLEHIDDGSMIVRNRTPRAQRTVTIGDLKVHRAVDD